jgi:hypothetical protein
LILEKGEKIHIITRRLFDGDLRRHFAGTVMSDVQQGLLRIEGYAFIFNANTNQYEKRTGLRTRIFSLVDGRHIVNVLPAAVDIEKVHYAKTEAGHLVITDGGTFELEIN